MKNIHSIILSSIFFFLITMSAAQAEEMRDPAIARVVSKNIYYSDIAQEEQKTTEMNTEERTNGIKNREFKNLEFLIYSELKNQFLKDSEMQPTDDEIQQFISFSINEEAAQPRRNQSQREEILTQLQAQDLPVATREALNNHLKTLDQLIAFDKKRKKEESLIPNYEEIKTKSLQSTAKSFVTLWKFNKALYTKYGGRVIFQQAGYEPIDAYKAFLEEHTQAKSFEIYDMTYNQIFKDMYSYFKMGHNYLDKETADKYFSKPWWDPNFEPM